MASRLAQMQARFQLKQMQEKEEKLLKLYENQQQRTIERVSRGSAGSDGSITTTTTFSAVHNGKLKQPFDEKRQKAGIDRSYPLEPLKANGFQKTPQKPDQNRNVSTKSVIQSTVQRTLSQVTNGKPTMNKHKVAQLIYNNDNGIENYVESHYEDDNANELADQRDDLVVMMNDHNLKTLDDEEMPSLEVDVCDEPIVIEKLPVVEVKVPSGGERGVHNKKTEQKTFIRTKVAMTPAKKEIKPLLKKPALPSTSSPKRTPSISSRTSSQTSKASTPTTPTKSLAMAGRAKPSAASGPTRAPSTNRPSNRQAPKSAQSTVARDDLAACRYCSRRFASDRLQVHEDICARTGKKKRKIYDATKHRVEGTELEPFVRRNVKMPSSKIPNNHTETITVMKRKQTRSAKKGNWRQTHEEFISTIRAAKMAQQHIAKGGKLSDLPPPPPSSNPDYVQCPHCGRRFNESAAERHIPKCATFQYNKPKTTAGPPSRQPPNKVTRGAYR